MPPFPSPQPGKYNLYISNPNLLNPHMISMPLLKHNLLIRLRQGGQQVPQSP